MSSRSVDAPERSPGRRLIQDSASEARDLLAGGSRGRAGSLFPLKENSSVVSRGVKFIALFEILSRFPGVSRVYGQENFPSLLPRRAVRRDLRRWLFGRTAG